MKTKNSCVVYFLTRNLFLGYGLSLLMDRSSKDSYIGAFLGIFIGLIIMAIYAHIIKIKGDASLKEVFKSHKVLGMATRVLFLIISLGILLYALVIYKLFVVSFLLVASPVIFVTIPLIGLAIYVAFKGLKGITRVAGALVPISVTISILIYLSLTGLLEITNFLPILTTKPMNIITTALAFAGISTLPNILTLHFRGDNKGMLKMYGLATGLIVVMAIYVNGVLGEALLNIFRFPEYMVLKQIKLFQFIEKMENVLSIIWIFDLFITISMGVYSVKELVPEKKNKITTIGILAVMMYVINRVFVFDYVNELRIYYILPYVALGVPLVIIGLLYILLSIKKNNESN